MAPRGEKEQKRQGDVESNRLLNEEKRKKLLAEKEEENQRKNNQIAETQKKEQQSNSIAAERYKKKFERKIETAKVETVEKTRAITVNDPEKIEPAKDLYKRKKQPFEAVTTPREVEETKSVQKSPQNQSISAVKS